MHFDDNYYQGVIGNGRSCALIEPDSTISFACLPDFDSGTIFASLLDAENGGCMRLSMPNGRAIEQAYEPRTNILVTTFVSDDKEAAFRVIDFMPRYTSDGKAGRTGDAASDIVRVIEPIRGEPTITVHYAPRPEYGRFPAETGLDSTNDSIKVSTCGLRDDGHEIYESIFLYTNLSKQAILNQQPIALQSLSYLLVSYHDKVQPPNQETVELMLQRTRAYWLLWSERTHRPERYATPVLRSALALKLMQFDVTGALVAAATTSLPETIGEERNWDYRYCWIRDASMTVSTLRRIGHPRMASRFIDWMLRTVPTKDDHLQIMYGIRGERTLHEEQLNHLAGYHHSSPVRTGNAAYTQQQHDIYGILLDVIHQDIDERIRTPERLDQVWTRVRSVVRSVSQQWRQPDRGIWEIRGESKHFVFSKVLCWVAIDRALKIAQLLGKEAWYHQYAPLADEIHFDICQNGWNEEAQAFTQAYGSTALDAANLLLAHYGFLPPRDPRFVSTVERIEEDLCRDGLMYRYRNQDDFGEPSSAFTVCSFWLVKARIAIGRLTDARAMFERLLACANPKGLFAEDLDFKSRRQLGNFPQAYSHLALIDCALDLEGDNEEDEEDIIIEP